MLNNKLNDIKNQYTKEKFLHEKLKKNVEAFNKEIECNKEIEFLTQQIEKIVNEKQEIILLYNKSNEGNKYRGEEIYFKEAIKKLSERINQLLIDKDDMKREYDEKISDKDEQIRDYIKEIE